MCIESSGWRSLGAALAALIVNSLIGVLAVVAAFLIEARAEVAYKGGLNPDAPYVPIFWFRFVGPILLFCRGFCLRGDRAQIESLPESAVSGLLVRDACLWIQAESICGACARGKLHGREG